MSSDNVVRFGVVDDKGNPLPIEGKGAGQFLVRVQRGVKYSLAVTLSGYPGVTEISRGNAKLCEGEGRTSYVLTGLNFGQATTIKVKARYESTVVCSLSVIV